MHVDFGGPGAPVLALHGHFGRAAMWADIATELAPHHRVIALEQRAHGRNPHGVDVHPDAYVADAAAFLRDLDLGPLPVVGHSMGGVVAFRLAARHPDLVSTFVSIEGSASVEPPVLDPRGWPHRTRTLRELRRRVEEHVPDATYFLESAVEHPDGWGLLFDYADMAASQDALLGDWWPDWLASDCPALLVHGTASPILTTETAQAMATRRDATRLAVFPGRGHWVHDGDPAGASRAIAEFLSHGTHR